MNTPSLYFVEKHAEGNLIYLKRVDFIGYEIRFAIHHFQNKVDNCMLPLNKFALNSDFDRRNAVLEMPFLLS